MPAVLAALLFLWTTSAAAAPPGSAPLTNLTAARDVVRAQIDASGPLSICVSAFRPYTQIRNGSYAGMDVEMWRRMARDLELEEGADYEFVAYDAFEGMIGGLLDPSRPCDLAMSGITMTVNRTELGIQWSLPYLKGSLSVLVRSNLGSSDGWGFVRPFQWSLWLAVGLTLLLLPPLVLAIELLSQQPRPGREAWAWGLGESLHRLLLLLLTLSPFETRSAGARTALVCFAFMSLILCSTYTANLAAYITVQQLHSQINSIQDLQGQAVGTVPIWRERLQTKWGILATVLPQPPNIDDALDDMAALVRSGTLAALVFEEAPLEFIANNQPDCSLEMLPQSLSQLDKAIGFPSWANEPLIDALSNLILEMQEAGTLTELRDAYFARDNYGCPNPGEVVHKNNAVAFSDLYGLWVIIGAGVAVGVLFMLLRRLRLSASPGPPARPSASDLRGGCKGVLGADGSQPLPPQAEQFSSLYSVTHRQAGDCVAGALKQQSSAGSDGAAAVMSIDTGLAAGTAPPFSQGSTHLEDALASADSWLAAAQQACLPGDAAAALIAAARSLAAQAGAGLQGGHAAAHSGGHAAARSGGSSLVGMRRGSDLVLRSRHLQHNSTTTRPPMVVTIGSWPEEHEDGH